MAYYLDLLSPETYEAFGRSSRDVTGFRARIRNMANRIVPGDKLICYLTKLSRWCGVLEVISGPYQDDTPRFYPENDPFIVRFTVKPLIWLPKEKALPIHEEEVWRTLSFTRQVDQTSSTWTGKLRTSLGRLDDSDGQFLEDKLREQDNGGHVFEVDEEEYQKLLGHQVRISGSVVSVVVPENSTPEAIETAEMKVAEASEVRESIRIQALIARIGAEMGMRLWLPKADRAAVFQEWTPPAGIVLDILPLNYDDTTLKTIEQIDVLWLKGRSIVRAFEVEHTTSIYSGILRMADLMALQPNMDIKLHIVAPPSRREKVYQELRRPVFSLLERGPLSEKCTYIRYESLKELAQDRHLAHLQDSVIEELAEEE